MLSNPPLSIFSNSLGAFVGLNPSQMIGFCKRLKTFINARAHNHPIHTCIHTYHIYIHTYPHREAKLESDCASTPPLLQQPCGFFSFLFFFPFFLLDVMFFCYLFYSKRPHLLIAIFASFTQIRLDSNKNPCCATICISLLFTMYDTQAKSI